MQQHPAAPLNPSECGKCPCGMLLGGSRRAPLSTAGGVSLPQNVPSTLRLRASAPPTVSRRPSLLSFSDARSRTLPRPKACEQEAFGVGRPEFKGAGGRPRAGGGDSLVLHRVEGLLKVLLLLDVRALWGKEQIGQVLRTATASERMVRVRRCSVCAYARHGDSGLPWTGGRWLDAAPQAEPQGVSASCLQLPIHFQGRGWERGGAHARAAMRTGEAAHLLACTAAPLSPFQFQERVEAMGGAGAHRSGRRRARPPT